MTTSFADLGLPARLVEALAADGITDAFPVQAATLPDALAGKDLCGRAPTGSGKTLGFGIPMMVRISQAEPTKPTGLVLVPTRELAEQVQRAFVPLGRAQWRFIQAIYGGASFGPQIHSLRKGASVVVATPGRLLDIIEKGYCDLSAVEVCVVDEADRMADLGFMPDVRKILDMTPPTRQTMLWSATLDGDVKELISDYMKDPVRHDLLADVDQAPVDHKFVVTRPTERLDAAVALIEEHGPTIVFVKTRFGVDDVAEDLNRAGVKAGALHGARSQAVRQRVLDDFKRGRLQALVATDVAARGIHVDNVSLVLHYDMPDNGKDYTHRSGRTGRAGNEGLVIAFVPPSRQRLARQMSNAVGPDIMWEHGETPIERVPAGERETGNRDRGVREGRDSFGDRDRRGYRGDNDRNGRSGYGGGERLASSDRPGYGAGRPPVRGGRSGYRANTDRPDTSTYPDSGDRSGPSTDRPGYRGNSDRNSTTQRSGYRGNSDRNSTTQRPGYRGNSDRSGPSTDRPGHRGSGPSTDRPGYLGSGDRNSTNQRPGYRGNSDRNSTTQRHSYGAGTEGESRSGERIRHSGDSGVTRRPGRGDSDHPSNDWSPRPRRDGSRDRNDWSPRPRRDDDRGTAGGRFGRTDRARGDGPRSSRDGYPSSSANRSEPPTGRTDRDARPVRNVSDDRPWRDRGASPSTGGRPAPETAHKPHTGKPGVIRAGFKSGGPRAGTGKAGGFRTAPGGRQRSKG